MPKVIELPRIEPKSSHLISLQLKGVKKSYPVYVGELACQTRGKFSYFFQLPTKGVKKTGSV